MDSSEIKKTGKLEKRCSHFALIDQRHYEFNDVSSVEV